MSTRRKTLYIVSLILAILFVLVDLGGGMIGSTVTEGTGVKDAPAPGIGIPAMAILDGLVLLTTVLLVLPMLITDAGYAKVSGILTLIVSFLSLLGAIVVIFVSLALLLLMVALLLAIPFGTIAYFAAYADFNTGGAAAILGLSMTLKICSAIAVVVGNPHALKSKAIVLLFLTSLLGNVILSFLHGFPPGFLVSITDAIGAIIVAILGAIWALILLIGSIPAILKAIKPSG
ncbi:MAG: hypothetical protein ACYTGZ_10825 [Planctomycetota bacterium]|jgi:hypothetical protein